MRGKETPPPPDRLILVWGANPVVTSPHSWAFVERAREDGARVVVIDPLRSATAERADWHLRPLPGTDAALALGMMHVIVRGPRGPGLHRALHPRLRPPAGKSCRVPAGPRGRAHRSGAGPGRRALSGLRHDGTGYHPRPNRHGEARQPRGHRAGPQPRHRRTQPGGPAHGGPRPLRDRHRRYADYVLPATTRAEHLDLVAPWGSRYLSLNLPAIEPRVEALPNSEFFRRLARRLGLEEPHLYTSDEEIVRAALESDHPYLSGITFERLRRDGWARMNHPEPWFPFAAGDFPTPSGRCELHAESLIEEGMDPLPRHDPPTGEPTPVAPVYPLTFMSPKSQRYFLNSSHANQPRHLRAAGEPRIWIHPDDAARRGIVSGDTVRAYNARGSVELAAEVTDGTRPGLVAMAHGW